MLMKVYKLLDTPMPYILIGLIIYGIAYMVYSRYIDRKIRQSDPSRPTPAKQYFDGVEYFPVNRYVLFGYKFKKCSGIRPYSRSASSCIFLWLDARPNLANSR
jgi:carbon starvation protein